jgi:TRAP-type C4-dicarboxylate transport system substrate-binding protein
MQLFELSPADLEEAQKMMMPMWDDWTDKQGPVAKELLMTVKKALAQ